MNLTLRTTGRPEAMLLVEHVRDVAEADLGLLGKARGYEPFALKRITNRHHSLARMIASGATMGDCARVTGYQQAWISTLQTDPAFQDLVEHYRTRADDQYVDLHVKLATISAEAADLLAQRLEDDGDKVSLQELREIVKLGADRTGFGPQTKSSQTLNVNVGIGDRLEAARKRIAERREIIDVTPGE